MHSPAKSPTHFHVHNIMITILVVADSFDHFRTPIETYLQRLGSVVSLMKITPQTRGDPQTIRERETVRIIDFLQKHPRLTPVLLDEMGESMDTRAFHAFLRH